MAGRSLGGNLKRDVEAAIRRREASFRVRVSYAAGSPQGSWLTDFGPGVEYVFRPSVAFLAAQGFGIIMLAIWIKDTEQRKREIARLDPQWCAVAEVALFHVVAFLPFALQAIRLAALSHQDSSDCDFVHLLRLRGCRMEFFALLVVGALLSPRR